MRVFYVSLVISMLAGALVGCGGNSSSGGDGGSGGSGWNGGGGWLQSNHAQCKSHLAKFSPCGGNVEGSWELQALCGEMSGLFEDDECPGASGEIKSSIQKGTVIKFANGLFQTPKMRARVEVTSKFPLSCAEGLESCEDLEDFFFDTCTGGQTCTCTTQFEDVNEAESNPYTIQGNTITIEDDSGDEEDNYEYDYCVDGDTLYLGIDDDDGISLIVAKRR